MITTDYPRLMARYNRWQNESLYRAAGDLDDGARKADRGAFWGSIHGTLCHLLWGDGMWMARFDGGPRPAAPLAESGSLPASWDSLKSARDEMDTRIATWAETLELEAGQTLSWYSGALQRDVTKPLSICIAHFFNHQTHHRGQVHTMLTAAGARPDDTDLFVMPGL